ncbi:Zinc finger protein Gfi-1b [Amphibalanus amphitrite]|uniref:Zinc finger protein Gfi-1b n=1 Tax=Amphibalanus amphitrite TaxID=1232801 RepID=A0A6A4WAY7_AMPAM|nr:Zinc finger protein Gfi-1b [Amphibalanus amphitrite]
MELVPPPERVTLPAGANLVQCFVCTAMFYTQEDHDKHLKMHRKADILRAVSEHSRHVLLHHPHAHHHHHHHGHAHRGGARSADVGYKLELQSGSAAAVAHHDSSDGPAHHSHHHHHPLHAHQHQHHLHTAHSGWMEVPPPLPPPPPPPAHPSAGHHPAVLPELHSLHWPLSGATSDADQHSIIYPEPEAGPSGSGRAAQPSPHSAPSSSGPPDSELPAAELLCTEESLHSSCPSPGEPTAPLLRPSDYQLVQDFSMYGSAEVGAGPPPAYSATHSRRLHLSLSSEAGDLATAVPPAPPPPPPDAPHGPDFVSFKCIHCSREFASAEDIHVHLSEVSAASHVCQVCHEVCGNEWLLEEHMERHSSPRPFKCGVCGREFSNSSVHRQHILQHIPPRIRDRVENELPGSPMAMAAAPPVSPTVPSVAPEPAQAPKMWSGGRAGGAGAATR